MHLGLAPLRRLRADLASVRAGRRERVPADQPAEIAPVVAELNALLDQNAQNLERARGHVANLAHALKTPLATLSMALAEPARDRDGGAAPAGGRHGPAGAAPPPARPRRGPGGLGPGPHGPGAPAGRTCGRR
ncbi:hypothetical protein ACU4GA_29050 [Methylobacterium oryzae CBMB20]